MPQDPHEMTRLLQDWHGGDKEALDKLMPMVVDELRRIAKGHFAKEAPGHTLQPTALVNEVYLRLVDADRIDWQCRAQFFGIAARVMRRVLVDHARGRRAVKRGGDVHRTHLDVDRIASEGREVDLIALDDALNEMSRINPEGTRPRLPAVGHTKALQGLVEMVSASCSSRLAAQCRDASDASRDWLGADARAYVRWSGPRRAAQP